MTVLSYKEYYEKIGSDQTHIQEILSRALARFIECKESMSVLSSINIGMHTWIQNQLEHITPYASAQTVFALLVSLAQETDRANHYQDLLNEVCRKQN